MIDKELLRRELVVVSWSRLCVIPPTSLREMMSQPKTYKREMVRRALSGHAQGGESQASDGALLPPTSRTDIVGTFACSESNRSRTLYEPVDCGPALPIVLVILAAFCFVMRFAPEIVNWFYQFQ